MSAVREEAERRMTSKLTGTAADPVGDPLVMPAIITTILDLLAKFCGGGDTPPAAVAGQYRQMTKWERASVVNRTKRNMRATSSLRGHALNAAAEAAVTAAEQVAGEATPGEHVQFISDVMPLATDDVDLF